MERAGAAQLIAGLERLNLEFLPYLPCSTAGAILGHFTGRDDVRAFPVAKEEEGVGILCGLRLAGRRATLLIQDTGFGNALTALTTFAIAYHVPALILATRTGGLGEINAAVPYHSDALPGVLQAAGLTLFTLDARVPLPEWERTVVQAYQYAEMAHRPVGVLADLKRVVAA